MPGPLYVRIAETLAGQIAKGSLHPGDRAPSLRQLSQQQRVSMSTALQAYLWLESRGYLEARPQSGFYVRTPYAALIPEPEPEAGRPSPAAIGTDGVLASMMEAARDPALISFGPSAASPELFPNAKLNLILHRAVRRQPLHSTRYDLPPGVESLRRQIARRGPGMGCTFGPRDVTITSGAADAINLSLRAVARPGDVIAVEDPTYFGILGSAAALGMKVIEIPTHPQEGLDLNELERAIRKHRVKACITMTNCHNPLGFIMRDENKKALAELIARSGIALIEDDIYADLAFEGPRPRTAKSFDRTGSVLLCSSFSKILSPGYRVGWVAGGRFRAEIERLQLLTTMAAPSLQQIVVAEFLESGAYDRHLKRLRASLVCQMDAVRQAAARYLPEGTRISRPSGGYVLWVQLPRRIDALKLYHTALAEHVSILPGTIFSATGRYRNYIRMNCGHRWSEAHDRALLTLGRLCDRALAARAGK
ncbi:MAG TPA: PLP-dependent aminotransferase family protein [Bryobacteraceae bacterium]|nr:PLP-dependent aminotransferase family protein [Bryobacteraceae bacterium]